MEKAATYVTPETNGEPVIKKHRLMNSGSSPHINGLTPVRQRLEQQRKKLLETESQGPQEISPTLQKLRDTPGKFSELYLEKLLVMVVIQVSSCLCSK